MPTRKTGHRPDNPQRVQQIKLRISRELHSQGKGALKDSATGYIPTDQEYNGAEIMGAALLPTAVDISNSHPVFDQANAGACSPFACCYAKDIDYYIRTGKSSWSSTTDEFSQSYIYDQVRFTDCSGGSAITQCLDIMVSQGDCFLNTFPYSDSDCNTLPNNTQKTEAALYKITSYSKLIHTDRTGIKTWLAAGKPVIVSFPVDNNFINAGPGFIWSAATSTGFGGAGHTVCVVGYDDSKNAYKIINSWGTGWGDSGFGWIDYDWFDVRLGYYAYTIDAIGSTPPPVNLPPIANAGFDNVVASGVTVALDGSASYDPDGVISAYSWAKVSGPSSPTINNATAAVASITPTVAGTYVYRLTVTDNGSATATDDVNITVTSSTTESYTITVNKTSGKTPGRSVNVINWNIALVNPPSSVSIERSTGSSSGPYSTLVLINPFVPQSAYTDASVSKHTVYYYRIKIVKSDGTVVYTNVVSVRD